MPRGTQFDCAIATMTESLVDWEAAAAAIVTRRAVLEWRDKHSINATLALSRVCRDIGSDIDARLAAIGWQTALVEPGAFISREISPCVAKAVQQAASRVMVDAQRDLDALVEHRLAVESDISGMPARRDTDAEMIDLIAGFAPFVGGIGVAAAVPGMAVVTGTAFFGLVATATISAPILVGGLTIAGIGIATGAVQTMQLGSMALSGVGIGVSIAGFAVLSHTLARGRAQVTAIDERLRSLERTIEDIRSEVVAEDFDRLRTACERVDEAWHVADPEPQWRQAAEELHGLQNRFARRVRRIVTETREITAVEPFIEAFALAGATRVTSRLAAGDTAAARHAGAGFSREFEQMTAPIGAAAFLDALLAAEQLTPGGPEYVLAVERLRSTADDYAASLREREAMAASSPIIVARLEQAGVKGRDWLEAARSRTDTPLLVLSTPPSR